ncbi:MAG: hypothetical protein HFE35_03155 [Clostridia bacterium]|uniref:hypothetical protein n=1 Tax=Pumilibacter muris TaxID=2941510 RepID=UPI00203F3D28|nr:hypothetical protein [Pumilibacter muris]MCI8595802.1 hypothetical protein [Clostridia bacterium]
MRKRFGIITLALSFMLCFCGCGNGENGGADNDNQGGTNEPPVVLAETVPDYLNAEATNPFTVGMWVGIPENKTLLDENDLIVGTQKWTEEEFLQQYQWIKEAGFNLATASLGTSTVEHIVHQLETAEKVGIKQLVWDERLNGVLLNTKLTDDDAVRQARRIVMEYSDYDSFYGNMITDEPTFDEFPALKIAAKRYKQVLPDKMFYLNLYPVEANSETQLKCKDYETYLAEYTSIGLDYLCYDTYPLLNSGKMLDTFLYNFQMAQNASDADVWTFLQAMGYGNRKEPSTEADFRIQANAALAYGTKAVQWFCYFSPEYGGGENFTPAIIALDGKKTAKYDLVKKVNEEIHALEHVYEQFVWQKAMNIVGSENSRGENAAFNYYETDNTHARIKKLAATKDTVVGCFKDGDGRDGFMVANYDLPQSADTDKVEITFADCTKVVCYINGERTELGVVNGKIALNLKAGDGAFVIPLNIVED